MVMLFMPMQLNQSVRCESGLFFFPFWPFSLCRPRFPRSIRYLKHALSHIDLRYCPTISSPFIKSNWHFLQSGTLNCLPYQWEIVSVRSNPSNATRQYMARVWESIIVLGLLGGTCGIFLSPVNQSNAVRQFKHLSAQMKEGTVLQVYLSNW